MFLGCTDIKFDIKVKHLISEMSENFPSKMLKFHQNTWDFVVCFDFTEK